MAYTLTLENPSQAPAYEVEVKDPIPTQLGQVTVSGGGVIQADEIYWRFDSLPPGQSLTMTWTGVVEAWVSNDTTEIVNRATVQDATGQIEADEAGRWSSFGPKAQIAG